MIGDHFGSVRDWVGLVGLALCLGACTSLSSSDVPDRENRTVPASPDSIPYEVVFPERLLSIPEVASVFQSAPDVTLKRVHFYAGGIGGGFGGGNRWEGTDDPTVKMQHFREWLRTSQPMRNDARLLQRKLNPPISLLAFAASEEKQQVAISLLQRHREQKRLQDALSSDAGIVHQLYVTGPAQALRALERHDLVASVYDPMTFRRTDKMPDDTGVQEILEKKEAQRAERIGAEIEQAEAVSVDRRDEVPDKIVELYDRLAQVARDDYGMRLRP